MKFWLFHIGLCLAVSSCDFPLLDAFPASEQGPRPTLPVLANAGGDREVLRGYVARLEGSGTYSPTGQSYTLRWQQIAGEQVHFSNPADPTPTFSAPLTEQDLIFRLVVDDGTWTTSDEVAIRVRRRPSALPPQVAAGPDRYLDPEEDGPGIADISSAVAAEVTTRWESVNVGASPDYSASKTLREPDALIYRLSAVRAGLSSAPDYLLLYRYDPDRAGDKAPTAALVAKSETAVPGQTVSVDASGSTDVNGDNLRWRWEQTLGTPVLIRSLGKNDLTLAAPNRPQEVLLRVFANDGWLESAPAQVSIMVNPDTEPPVVAPQQDSRTHPGNIFVLDADGLPTPDENPAVTFNWQQTFGESVELQFDTSGRFASFQAPPVTAVLAFAVVAELPDTLAPVLSTPDVALVEVVGTSDNLPPKIFVCENTAMIDSELRHVVTALVADPEADSLAAEQWELTTDPQVVVEHRVRAATEIIESALCDPQELGPLPAWAPLATVFQLDFAPPPVATLVTVRLIACDDLSAAVPPNSKCDEDAIEIPIQ